MSTSTAPDTLLDSAPCWFVSFGDDGRIALVNGTLLERLGYDRDELMGRHVETIFTVAGRLFFQTHFYPLVKLHGRAQELFVMLRTKSGEDVGALCNAVRHPRDGVVWTDCVLLEVRERRKYEDALLQARRSAEEAGRQAEIAHRTADAANRAKSEFLAVMSHELRTPLNAIGGYTQLLETEVYGPVLVAQREALGRIARSQRHLLGLINDVLNLARVEAGRVDYAMENVKLHPVVAELAEMIAPQVAGAGLTYEAAISDRTLAVRADRDKLMQVILNLLSNAVKFTAEGGAVTMRCGPAEGLPETVLIEVADSGRGIPADKLEAVFEPFVQVRAGRAGSNEGTGLGLAISRNLARGMGGELSATSEVGVGSRFLLTLARAGSVE